MARTKGAKNAPKRMRAFWDGLNVYAAANLKDAIHFAQTNWWRSEEIAAARPWVEIPKGDLIYCEHFNMLSEEFCDLAHGKHSCWVGASPGRRQGAIWVPYSDEKSFQQMRSQAEAR